MHQSTSAIQSLTSTTTSAPIVEPSFLNQLSKILTERFLHTFDELVALIFSIISVAAVYWVMKRILLLVEIDEHSFKYAAVSYIILFVEISLVLKFLWDKLRKH